MRCGSAIIDIYLKTRNLCNRNKLTSLFQLAWTGRHEGSCAYCARIKVGRAVCRGFVTYELMLILWKSCVQRSL